MKVERQVVRAPDPKSAAGSQGEMSVFVATCEHCGFAAMSIHEQDAIAVVERHESAARHGEEVA